MPGICGIIEMKGSVDVAELLDRMVDLTCHHTWYQCEKYIDSTSRVGIGRSTLGLVSDVSQPATDEDGSAAMWVGEWYETPNTLESPHDGDVRETIPDYAGVVLRGYRREGKAFFRKLNGRFNALIWDATQRRLIVTGDRLGMKPLYYSQLPGMLLVASELKALLTEPRISKTLNIRGISQFLTFGQYLEQDTYLSSVRVLPPASWLEYDVDNDQLTLDRYWHLEEIATRPRLDAAESFDRIDEAFTRVVSRHTRGHSIGLSLSGGVDSRTILAAVDLDRSPIKTLTLGVEGCADHAVAAQLAKLAGCSHHNHVLDLGFLSDFEKHLRRMIHLTDGMYLSECLVLSTLPLFRQLGIDVLLRGHGGELMHMDSAYNYSLDRNVGALQDESQLEDWLFDRLRGWMLAENRHPMLAPSLESQFEPAARESLHACLAESVHVEPLVDRVWHLFISQRLRRETALSIAKLGSVTEIRLPYLDNELLDILLTTPTELRLNNKIQQQILHRQRPAFLQVSNVNTGTRIGAGRILEQMATFRSKVLAKLHVRGYGHYEHMGRWLRCELRPLVESILLSDRCLSRGVFHPDSVPLILQEQFTSQRNHTFLILGMMILELALCEFVDSSP